MSSEYPIKQALPLLELGRLLHDLHLLRYPSQRSPLHCCQETADEIRLMIRQQEVAAEYVLLANNAPARLKTARRPATTSGKEQTYILALIAYSYFSAIFWDRSVDGICRGVAVALTSNPLLGALRARKALLELISYGVLGLVDSRNVELSPAMVHWITEGNPLLSLSPSEVKLKRLHAAELAKEANQKTFGDYQKQLSGMTFAKGKALEGGKILLHAVYYQ